MCSWLTKCNLIKWKLFKEKCITGKPIKVYFASLKKHGWLSSLNLDTDISIYMYSGISVKNLWCRKCVYSRFSSRSDKSDVVMEERQNQAKVLLCSLYWCNSAASSSRREGWLFPFRSQNISNYWIVLQRIRRLTQKLAQLWFLWDVSVGFGWWKFLFYHIYMFCSAS